MCKEVHSFVRIVYIQSVLKGKALMVFILVVTLASYICSFYTKSAIKHFTESDMAINLQARGIFALPKILS